MWRLVRVSDSVRNREISREKKTAQVNIQRDTNGTKISLSEILHTFNSECQ